MLGQRMHIFRIWLSVCFLLLFLMCTAALWHNNRWWKKFGLLNYVLSLNVFTRVCFRVWQN